MEVNYILLIIILAVLLIIGFVFYLMEQGEGGNKYKKSQTATAEKREKEHV